MIAICYIVIVITITIQVTIIHDQINAVRDQILEEIKKLNKP